jgi:hypothetical protein
MERRSRGLRFKSLLLHISVSRVSDISENHSKSARARAICNRTRTQRARSAARIRRIRQNLSGRDFARSVDHRREFASRASLSRQRISSAGSAEYLSATDPDAWDWTQNAQHGVNKFSGYVKQAVMYETSMLDGSGGVPARMNAGNNNPALGALSPEQRENNALVLYGGAVGCTINSCRANELYYIPECTGTISKTIATKGNYQYQDWICNDANWQWVENDDNLPKRYICPAGVTCHSGQAGGIKYVSSTTPNHLGVRTAAQQGGCCAAPLGGCSQ